VPDHLQLPDASPLPDRRTQPGPRTPTRNPRRHGERLNTDLEQAVERAREIRIVEGVDPALVFRVKTSGRVGADKWRNRGLELLTEGGDWDYVVLSPGVAPPKIGDELHRYTDGPDEEGAPAPLSSFFAMLEEIHPYGSEDRLPVEVAAELDLRPGPVDLVIWPASSDLESKRRVEQVLAVVRRVGGTVTATDRNRRSPAIRATLDGPMARELATVPVLELLRLPAIPYVDPSDWRDIRAEDLRVERRDGPPIGVLDDAIGTANPLLRDVVEGSYAFPETHAWQPPGDHGTMVAGLAAYGDFEQPLRDHVPFTLGGPLIQARIIEPRPDRPDAYRFAPGPLEHLTVADAITTLHAEHDVRVFVLSVTEVDPYSGPHVSILTERLDDLIREHDLVVVLPTGNHGASIASRLMGSGDDVVTGYPAYALDEVARVSEPGTAALALTVGSIARSEGPATLAGKVAPGAQAVAPADGLSPFSRSGPGAFKGVKPDLVHYGGNWVIRADGTLAVRDAGAGVVSTVVTDTRMFHAGAGTSFAAPRVARAAADVLAVYPDASGNLVRALVALSAKVPQPVADAFGDDVPRVAGHGLPRAARATASAGSRVVLMGEFSMMTDTVAIHALPIPRAFHDGRAARAIRVSLAFDPPVRRTRREYLAGAMSFDLIRATGLDEVAAIYRKQDDDPLSLPKGRRRMKLIPGSQTFDNSTLMVRGIRTTAPLSEDDGDTYLLAVTHNNRPWARQGEQRYAIAVEFEELDRQDIDLYAQLSARVRPRARIRGRLPGA
jgi:hypothetical protein